MTKKVSWRRINWIMDAALQVVSTAGEDVIRDISFANGYAEPGYSDPEAGQIALGNWNSIRDRKHDLVDNTPERLEIIFTKLGIPCEWSDEWQTCVDCLKIVRTEPDCAFWKPSYVHTDDGYILCKACSLRDPQFIFDLYEGQWKAIPFDELDLGKYNYILVDADLASGMHSGETNNPQKIIKNLKKANITRFLFKLGGCNMFTVNFELWLHEDEKDRLEEAQRIVLGSESRHMEPAEAFRKAIRASNASPDPPGAGPVIEHINLEDGTLTKERLKRDG